MNANESLAISNNELFTLASEYDTLIAELDEGRPVDEGRLEILTETIEGAPQLANKPVGVPLWLEVATACIELGENPITLEQYLRWALEGHEG